MNLAKKFSPSMKLSILTGISRGISQQKKQEQLKLEQQAEMNFKLMQELDKQQEWRSELALDERKFAQQSQLDESKFQLDEQKMLIDELYKRVGVELEQIKIDDARVKAESDNETQLTIAQKNYDRAIEIQRMIGRMRDKEHDYKELEAESQYYRDSAMEILKQSGRMDVTKLEQAGQTARTKYVQGAETARSEADLEFKREQLTQRWNEINLQEQGKDRRVSAEGKGASKALAQYNSFWKTTDDAIIAATNPENEGDQNITDTALQYAEIEMDMYKAAVNEAMERGDDPAMIPKPHNILLSPKQDRRFRSSIPPKIKVLPNVKGIATEEEPELDQSQQQPASLTIREEDLASAVKYFFEDGGDPNAILNSPKTKAQYTENEISAVRKLYNIQAGSVPKQEPKLETKKDKFINQTLKMPAKQTEEKTAKPNVDLSSVKGKSKQEEKPKQINKPMQYTKEAKEVFNIVSEGVTKGRSGLIYIDADKWTKMTEAEQDIVNKFAKQYGRKITTNKLYDKSTTIKGGSGKEQKQTKPNLTTFNENLTESARHVYNLIMNNVNAVQDKFLPFSSSVITTVPYNIITIPRDRWNGMTKEEQNRAIEFIKRFGKSKTIELK